MPNLPGFQLDPLPLPYLSLADRLLASGRISDPWSAGHPRFYCGVLRIHPQRLERFYQVAHRIGYVFECAAQHIWQNPTLLDTFFAMLPFQKLMWLASGGQWHGFARIDAFLCADNTIQVCELNADTPSGQVDAFAITSEVQPSFPHLQDPNRDYEANLWSMICRLHKARTGQPHPTHVGIVFPTEMPEDLALIHLYHQWFEARGCEVYLGAPFNLSPNPDGGVSLFGHPIDTLFRHYKTDWWGERWPVWADSPPFQDPDPLSAQLGWVLAAENKGKLSIINPFGAIIPQNKLTLAFCWEHIDRFPPDAQATIRAHIPPTFRLDTLGREHLKTQRTQWVLKSDFGCEGDEVVVGPLVSDEVWHQALDLAVDDCWVAQSYFEIAPLDGFWPNHGIYLIAGQPAGILTRLSPPRSLTDVTAQVVSVLIDPSLPYMLDERA